MYKAISNMERFIWMLCQSIWVGGVWITIIVVYPALNKTLLAPLLIQDAINVIASRIVVVVVACIAIELILFIKTSDFELLFKDPIGLTLVMALLCAMSFLVFGKLGLISFINLAYLYVAIALCGLFVSLFLPPWLRAQNSSKIYNKKIN